MAKFKLLNDKRVMPFDACGINIHACCEFNFNVCCDFHAPGPNSSCPGTGAPCDPGK